MMVLDNQVSVSGQLLIDDLPALAAEGVEILVCNRPDKESPDQTDFHIIEAEAKKQGLQVENIPFAGGQLQPEHVSAFVDLMDTGKRIHAYCRTGNRCTQLWNVAKQV